MKHVDRLGVILNGRVNTLLRLRQISYLPFLVISLLQFHVWLVLLIYFNSMFYIFPSNGQLEEQNSENMQTLKRNAEIIQNISKEKEDLLIR